MRGVFKLMEKCGMQETRPDPASSSGIKDDSLLFDARTLQEKDFGDILLRISSIIQ